MSQDLQFRISPMQAAVQTALQKHGYLSDVPVLTEQTGDIENEIDRALGTVTETKEKIGICCVVLTPRASNPKGACPGPTLDPLQIVVAVVENVVLNTSAQGTKKSALKIVEFLLRYLHRRAFAELNSVLIAGRQPFRVTNTEPLTYEVTFEAVLALEPIQE